MRKFILSARLLFIAAMLCLSLNAGAQAADSLLLQKMDSVEISLITVDPGKEIWNLYGHTALRFHDLSDGRDLGINYGVFSFDDDGFVWRFVFGTTDYEMGIFPMKLLIDSYKQEHRGIYEQLLDLTAQDKLQIYQALLVNAQPGNATYRYNYFFDNCTTRARNIVERNLTGELKIDHIDGEYYPSFRQLIHEYNEEFPWARFGNDILLGYQADRSTSFEEQQFLPFNLRNDFDSARYNGKPLVKRATWLLPQTFNENGHINKTHTLGQVLSPTVCFVALLLVAIALTIVEYWRRRLFWGFDLALMLLCGLAGCVLTVMLFSEQPTVRVNFQLLLINPLPLIFAWSAVRRWRQGKSHWIEKTCDWLAFLFIMGGFVQVYAEGMNALALTLLLRAGSRILILKRINKQPCQD